MILQKLRDRLTGIMAIFILGLLAVPFALVGVNSYFAADIENNIAIVNDESITLSDFNTSYQNFRERMRSLMGQSFDAAYFDDPVVRRQHLEGMIDQEILRQVAGETGLSVDNQILAQAIRDVPGFQIEGEFNLEVYQSQLSSQGLTPQDFEDRMRNSMVLRQFPNSIRESAIATRSEVERFISLQEQERAFSALMVPADSVSEDAAENEDDSDQVEGDETGDVEVVQEASGPTEEKILQWYEEHAGDYRHPERVVVEYVELDAAFMQSEDVIDEDTLRQRFEDQSARFISPEARLASHILISVDPSAAEADVETARQAAQAIYDRAIAGEDFAALALEFSEDQGSAASGGDLDWVEPGVMVEAFENALYELSMESPISEPVQTGFGWHLIQLRDIRPAEGMTFDEARITLETEMIAEQNERLFIDAADRLVDIIYEDPTTLEAAADELGLEIRQAGPFDRTGGTEGVLANAEFVETAFSDLVLLQGSASDPINLGENHMAVVRVLEHLPEAAKSLDEVRDEVIAAIEQDEAMMAARGRAEELLTRLENGESLEALAEETGLELLEFESARRTSGEVPPGLRAAVFELSPPAEGEVAIEILSLDNGYALVSLNEVRAGVLSEEEEPRRESYRQRLANVAGSSEFEGFMSALREQSEIQVFEDRF